VWVNVQYVFVHVCQMPDEVCVPLVGGLPALPEMNCG